MSTPQIVILIALIALVVFSLLWIIVPILRRRYIANHLVPHFGKRIYHIALYNDFYLINQINLKLDDANEAHIDHLLFGEKYIYVIKDRYYDGALTGQERDVNWMFYPRFNRRGKYITNPFLLNRVRVEKLALVTGLDQHFFINVIVTNDQCLLDDIVANDKATYIVKLKKLEKLIKTIEEREIAPIEPDQLDRAVKDIHRLVKG
ncbi:MAG: nuclease-related domain-containing protein [Bacilli bacterium]|jgi:hypothetical protein